MVTYQPPDINDVPIIDAIKLSTVSSSCTAVLAARALGISFGDEFVEACFRNRPGREQEASDVAAKQAQPKAKKAASSL